MNALSIAPADEHEFHLVAEAFPMLDAAELSELAADIAAHGLREPILKHRDGQVIDGRNRLAACRLAGVEPTFRTYEGPDEKLVDLVLSLNVLRRHLNESQRAMAAAKLATLRKGRPGGRENSGIPLFTQAEAAKRLNVSVDSVKQAHKVRERGSPELVTKVERNVIRLNKAVAQLPPAPVRLASNKKPFAAVSLEEWEGLDEATRARLLVPSAEWGRSTFNPQTNDSIGWAQWSWNPVTGCLHDCTYCYARVIAKSARMREHYPNEFRPTLHPPRLIAPAISPQRDASADWTERNVFVCSMADLWGRWVPEEWIQAVLDACRAAPQWTFLFLTKFPKRMAEFDIPPNAWMGTTVDLQARVRPAEEAFAKLREKSPGVRTWLSLEPILERLRFKRMDLFDLVAMGGATKQPATDESPETHDFPPPFEWIVDLHGQARAAGCRVWHKDNLWGNSVREMMDGLPVKERYPQEAPEVFRYLGRKA